MFCRNKRLRGSQCLSAITSALKYEEDDEGGDEEEEELGEPMDEDDDENVEDEAEDDEEGDDEEESGPLWQLFECVRSYSSSQGEETSPQETPAGEASLLCLPACLPGCMSCFFYYYL